MSNRFAIRIELFDATSQEYSTLAESLMRIGVVDTIVCDEGVLFKLPPAEYIYKGTESLDQVYEALEHVVSRVGPEFNMIVHERIASKWQLRLA